VILFFLLKQLNCLRKSKNIAQFWPIFYLYGRVLLGFKIGVEISVTLCERTINHTNVCYDSDIDFLY
jgi:hypothetical protein